MIAINPEDASDCKGRVKVLSSGCVRASQRWFFAAGQARETAAITGPTMIGRSDQRT